jgi:hypothetical protein
LRLDWGAPTPLLCCASWKSETFVSTECDVLSRAAQRGIPRGDPRRSDGRTRAAGHFKKIKSNHAGANGTCARSKTATIAISATAKVGAAVCGAYGACAARQVWNRAASQICSKGRSFCVSVDWSPAGPPGNEQKNLRGYPCSGYQEIMPRGGWRPGAGGPRKDGTRIPDSGQMSAALAVAAVTNDGVPSGSARLFGWHRSVLHEIASALGEIRQLLAALSRQAGEQQTTLDAMNGDRENLFRRLTSLERLLGAREQHWPAPTRGRPRGKDG